MAPARKRGAKGSETKGALSLGDLVLAKVKGFPAWPAKVSRPEDWNRAPDPKKYFVQFFGTEEIAFVAPADIQAFTNETKNKLSARCQGKTVKYFAEAVKEICEAFEVVQQKCSSGLRDDTDRLALGCEAPSVDGVEDDALEVDLKDEICKDGTNEEMEIRGPCERSSGLEHCSRKKNKLSNGSAQTSEGLVLASSPHNTSCPKEETCVVKHEDNAIFPPDSIVGTPAEGLESNHNDGVCDAQRDGQNNLSSPLLESVSANHSVGGNNFLTNGHKSEKMTSSKWSPNGERAKNVILIKNRSTKESSPNLKSDVDDASRNKAKKMMIDGKYFGANDGKMDAEGSPEEQDSRKLSGRKKVDQIGPAKRDSVIIEVSRPCAKLSWVANDGKKDVDGTPEQQANEKLFEWKKGDEIGPAKCDSLNIEVSRPCAKLSEVANDGKKDAEGSSEEQANGKLSGWKRGDQIGPAKCDSVIIDVSCPSSKLSGVANDGEKDSEGSPEEQTNGKLSGWKRVDQIGSAKCDSVIIEVSRPCAKLSGVANDGKKDSEGSPEEQANEKLSGSKKGDQIGPAKRDSVTIEISHPCPTLSEVANDGKKDSEGSPEEQATGKLSGWKRGDQIGSAKCDSVIIEVSRPCAKPSEVVSDGKKDSEGSPEEQANEKLSGSKKGDQIGPAKRDSVTIEVSRPCPKLSEVANDGKKDSEGSPEEQATGKLSGWKRGDQVGSAKCDSVIIEVSRPCAKPSGVVNDGKKDSEGSPEEQANEKLSGSKKGDQIGPAKRDSVTIEVSRPCPKLSEVANDGKKDSEGSPEEQATGKLSGWKKGDQIGPAKHDSVIIEVSRPAKKYKHADMENNVSKESHYANIKSDSRSSNVARKAENIELKMSPSPLKTENRSRVQVCSLSSNIPSDEESLPSAKRRRRLFEAMSNSAIITSENRTDKVPVAMKNEVYSDKVKSPVTQLHTKRRAVRLFAEDDDDSDKVKSPVTQLHTKRRAVRLFDEDDDEARTPIHGGPVSNIHASSGVSDCMTNPEVKNEVSPLDRSSLRDSGEVEVGLLKEYFPSKILNESSSLNAEKHREKRPKKVLAANISHCPGKLELERVSSKESKKIMNSPKRSLLSGVTNKSLPKTPNTSRQSKVSGAGNKKKFNSGPGKAPSIVADSLNYYHNQVITQRSVIISSGEISKNTVENNSFPDERLETVRDDRMSSFIDVKISDPATSIKHLIAAAQAKRRQSHSQNISHGNAGSLLAAPSTEVSGRSPSPVVSVHPLLSGSNILLQPDVQGYYPHTSIASPSNRHLILSNNQSDCEEFVERRVSSGHRPAGGSLSGGTEAAVARDAFEGMIETLSRTKESIGRATRLAIDCAKYGIANEVVELLIRKLESETSFHRKVDLFFLVDSITQCSHHHKGIAGASYIPTVQAALPRLLGAAAPSGAAASENRRQCIKVLRLWLERKILPESLLRRYIDEIVVPNNDASSGFFLRRPSRTERALDDPIREMEGMLVDEYGSNATFQLPGFLSSHVFEEDDEEDLPSSSYKEVAGGSPVESVPATGDGETCSVTPNDRRHFVLEDVDGELEMEDVSGNPKDEKPFFANNSVEYDASQGQGSDGILETNQNYSNDLDPDPKRDGSPPLPFDSPPPTPPLPPSPPPPPSPSPTPALSSSPHPPAPSTLPLLPNPVPLSSLVPQPSVLSQPSLSPQPSMVLQNIHASQPTSSSSMFTYQPPLPHEYNSIASGNKVLQMAGNTPHGVRIDVRSEMYAHQSSCFVPTAVCNPPELSGFTSLRPLDYARHGSYLNSQASQPIHQFQTGNAPLRQTPFPPVPPSQTQSSHYLYPTSMVQQHSYPRPYSLPNHPDGPRRYVADEHWRISAGYFRPLLGRLPANNVGFQSAAPGSLPAGVPVPGHTVSQLLPNRPNMTAALNIWRPS